MSLAERMRPTTLADFVGQRHLLAPGEALHESIRSDRLTSFVVWGPPGSGKTSLARIIARVTARPFVACSAATAGRSLLRRVAREARETPVVLFVDEVHRLSPQAQDYLLPMLESERVVLLGATTLYPDDALTPSLLSRATPFPFKPLAEDDLRVLLHRAFEDPERGLPAGPLALDPAIEDFLLAQARGDARVLLNALERLAMLPAGQPVTVDGVAELVRPRGAVYQGGGDNHHDVVTAFVKSMRGGDPDATLYWLSRMLVACEDGRFIASRVCIAAAEDVGLADPFALVLANAAADLVDRLGLPEARAALAEAALYVATSQKSGSAGAGLERALYENRTLARHEVPLHLRQRTLRGAPEANYSQGGQYPQRLTSGFLFRQYLPDALSREVYYDPSDEGYEARMRERLREWWPERPRPKRT